jgi:hypothetical protein
MVPIKMNTKLDDNTELVLTIKVGEQVDQNGRRIIQVAKNVANREVNFGSLIKPLNREVISFEYKNKNNVSNILGSLFK